MAEGGADAMDDRVAEMTAALMERAEAELDSEWDDGKTVILDGTGNFFLLSSYPHPLFPIHYLLSPIPLSLSSIP